MATLRVRLFGTLELTLGDLVLPAFQTAKAKSLFCFLVVNRQRMFPRAALLGQFWPDSDESIARRNLRTCLWRIRRIIEPRGALPGSYLKFERDKVGFCPTDEYWLDIDAFEAVCVQLERSLAASSIDAPELVLPQLLHLYRSHLLDELYDDWCVFERERQRFAFLAALERLALRFADCSSWESALTAARLLLHHDPLREQIHRLIMRCQWRSGNRPAALQQYQLCARLLRVELDSSPMAETTALHEAILADDPTAVARTVAPLFSSDATVSSTMIELDAAAAHLAFARQRLLSR